MIVTVDQEKQRLYRDAYFATGGFENGKYLVKTEVETAEKYEYRQSMGSYSNFYQVSVDANLLPIFDDVKRGYNVGEGQEANPQYELLVDDIDGNGTDLDTFLEEAGIEADYSGAIITLQNSTGGSNSSREDDLNGSNYPYVTKYTQLDIVEYELDGRLNIIYFTYPYTDEYNATKYNSYYYNKEEKQAYMYKDTTPVGFGGKFNPTGDFDLLDHKAKVLATNTQFDPNYLPNPKYASIVQSSKSHYQLTSLMQYQALTSTVSIMDFPGQLSPEGVVVTEQTIIQNEHETRGIEFKTPENTMERLRDEADALKKDIFTVANLSILFTDASASGESKKMSDNIRVQQLKPKSNAISRFDKMMMKDLLSTIGLDYRKYEVAYPADFESMTLSQTILDNIAMLDMGLSPDNEVLIKVDTMLSKFPNLTDGQKQNVIASEMSNVSEEQEPIEDDDDIDLEIDED